MNTDKYGQRRFRYDDKHNIDSAIYVRDLNWGLTTFDDFGMAFLSIFQCITLEGWTGIMYQIQDAHNNILGSVFFVLLAVLGGVCLINLTLAMIYDTFNVESEAAQDEEEFAAAQKPALVLDEDVEVVKEGRERRKSNADEVKALARERAGNMRKSFVAQQQGSAAAMQGASSSSSNEGGGGTTTQNTKKKPSAVSPADGEAPGATVGAGNRDAREWRDYVRAFVTDARFNNVVLVVIVLNTIILSMDHHPIDPDFALFLEMANFVFTIFFALEMVVKLVGLGLADYVSDRFNVFDGFIVIMSFVELGLAPPSFMQPEDSMGGSGGGALSALRTFRIMRVFKLLKSLKSLRVLLNVILTTLSDVAYFCLLLGLMMFIFSLAGSQFFANAYHFHESSQLPVRFGEPGYAEGVDRPRGNFNSFLWAFTSIFQILSGENWPDLMYDASRSRGTGFSVFFVAVMMVGNWILFNLLLAIILGNFGTAEEAEADNVWGAENGLVEGEGGGTEGKDDDDGDDEGAEAAAKRPPSSLFVLAHDNCFRMRVSAVVKSKPFDNFILFLILVSSVLLALDNPLTDPTSTKYVVLATLDEIMAYLFMAECALKVIALGFVLHKGSYLRDGWNILDFLIVCLSILNIIVDKMDTPSSSLSSSPSSPSSSAAEAVMNLTANATAAASGGGGGSGLKSLRSLRALRALRPLRMVSRMPKLKKIVNALFAAMPGVGNTVLICFLFWIIFGVMGVNLLKGALNDCQGDAFEALNDTAKALIVCPSLMYGFDNATREAWLVPQCPERAPHLLANLSSINASAFPSPVATGPGTSGRESWTAPCDAMVTPAPTSRDLCECWGGEWLPVIPQNFDNLPSAILALFELCTTEGWFDVMHAAVDSTGIDMQPIRGSGIGWVFFFIFYIIVGAFFMINLFVGAVIDAYLYQMRDDDDGDALELSEDAEGRADIFRLFRSVKPRRVAQRPSNPICSPLFTVAEMSWFEPLIMSIIILNTFLMMATAYTNTEGVIQAFETINLVFAIVFTVEAVIKLGAYGGRYFLSGWNIFDFTVVVGTWVGLLLKWFTPLELDSVAMVIRAFRVLRILRLTKNLKSLQKLFRTILSAAPAMGNILLLLCLVLFIFAVMGVQLFARVSWGDGSLVNTQAHFRSFGAAFITLFRHSTGEAWNEFMYALAPQPGQPSCNSDPRHCNDPTAPGSQDCYGNDVCGLVDSPDCAAVDGCGTLAAYPFFILFTLVVGFVMLNLFVAVILEGFAASSDDEFVGEAELEGFVTTWSAHDPRASGRAPYAVVQTLVTHLPPPMGFGIPAGTKLSKGQEGAVRQRIAAMPLDPDDDDNVTFVQVAEAFAAVIADDVSVACAGARRRVRPLCALRQHPPNWSTFVATCTPALVD